MTIYLVTGGVKSGKSRFAEGLSESLQSEVIYIATSRPKDEEMAQRVIQHREERPAHWGLIEEPLRLAEAIYNAPSTALLLIEDVATWVANLLFAEGLDEDYSPEGRIEFLDKMKQEVDYLLQVLQGRPAVLVTGEVGLGGVAIHPVTRLYQDALGEVNQRLAEVSREVWLVVSGVPTRIKG